LPSTTIEDWPNMQRSPISIEPEHCTSTS